MQSSCLLLMARSYWSQSFGEGKFRRKGLRSLEEDDDTVGASLQRFGITVTSSALANI